MEGKGSSYRTSLFYIFTFMNFAIIGFGKMGQLIRKIVLERGHAEPLIIDPSLNKILAPDLLKKIDVAIEFSSPEAAPTNYLTCFKAGIPVVSGTTGWLEKWPEIEQAVKDYNAGFFYASNFSLGVHLFFKLNETLARLMTPYEEYQAHIEEIHHIQKLDAPSGTAITLAEGVLNSSKLQKQWVSQFTGQGSDIPIYSIREGQVTGTHTVSYVGPIDKISIKHEAFSREGFALGAVIAAEYLSGKKGIFSMTDLLSEK